jgi:hypothetical protein
VAWGGLGWAGLGRRGGGGGGRGWGTWARRLTPVAAAVAVIVVVIAVVGIGRSMHSPAGRAPATTAPRPGPVLAGPPISSYVASGQVPRYYVSITSRDNNSDVNPSYAVVAVTASGKTLATIQPSVPHGTIVAVTAAGDDRTFVLDEERWTTSASGRDDGARTFYRLLLGTDGYVEALDKLPVSVPSGYQLDGLALSPDASKLAVALEPATNTTPDLAIVKVYTLATGAVRTWTGDGGNIGSGPDDARSLSWTNDGRTLTFDWTGNGNGKQNGNGQQLPASIVRLLRLHAPGSDLMAVSRPALSLGGPLAQPRPPVCQADLIITPDGSKVVCGAIQSEDFTRDRIDVETEFREFSTVTGQVTAILGYWKFHDAIPNVVGVLWSNTSGSVLIGVIPGGGHGRIGVISGNTFTPLPAAVSASSADVADDQSGTW